MKGLSKQKLSSIHKSLTLLSLSSVNQFPLVTQLLHSKYNFYPHRKWNIDNAKISTTTVMKNMSRVVANTNKISFIWMLVPPLKLKTWDRRILHRRRLMRNLFKYHKLLNLPPLMSNPLFPFMPYQAFPLRELSK